MLGCLQSLSDRLTDLEESRSVLAAPVQLAHGSTSDSDCVDDQQQTDELGQFLDGEFSPTPDQQVGDSDAFADSLCLAVEVMWVSPHMRLWLQF